MTQPPDATQPVAPVPPGGAAPPPPPPPQAGPAQPYQTGPTATTAFAPGTPPPPAAPGSKPAGTMTLVSLGIGIAVLLLTVVALSVKSHGQRGYHDWTAWAIFATVVCLGQLVPLVWRTDPKRVWAVVAASTGALALYWVAVVLPFVTYNTSFAQTLAVGLAVLHCCLLPGRPSAASTQP